MVDEELVHYNCLVTASECSLIAHKTYKEHYLVKKLKEKNNKLLMKKQSILSEKGI